MSIIGEGIVVGNYFVIINLKEFLMYLWGKAFIEKIKEQARDEVSRVKTQHIKRY